MSGWRTICCEVCERNPTCGNDCGSCSPETPAGRLEFLFDLYAPPVEQEDGSIVRDPELGIIDKDTLLRLLNLPEAE